MEHEILVWSATPTPFTRDMRVDVADVERMIEHHVRLGVEGIMLAGTCGEGPWMLPLETERLVEASAKAGGGRIRIAVQVSDNSADRIVRNAEAAAERGAELVVIAPPFFLLNATPANVLALYLDAIRRSPLPVIIYDVGGRQVGIPIDILEAIYSEPNVVMVKDSSGDPGRRSVAKRVRERRPNLKLLTGDEFQTLEHLRDGYDGMLLGGAIISGAMCRQLADAVRAGDWENANKWQQAINDVLYGVYGGRDVACWLAGLKHALVRMGVFSSIDHYLNYPLSRQCKEAVDELIVEYRDCLFLEVARLPEGGSVESPWKMIAEEEL